MSKYVLLIMISMLIFCYCAQEAGDGNPFFSEYKTQFKTPPFDKIKIEHYMPAFKEGIAQHNKEIDAIVNNSAEPAFANTIEALERSGELLTKVSNVFYNLNSANTNDQMQDLAREVAPMLTEHYSSISLNLKLFERIKKIYNKKDELNLTPEQVTLLERNYKDFVRNGANLDDEKKKELVEIDKELAQLTLKFGENVLKEDNNFKLVLESEKDLDGLPQRVIDGAGEAAKEAGLEGKWVITLHKPSWIPFLQYSTRRDLREKIYRAYYMRGDNDNEYDNKNVLKKIASLRVKRAQLLGYKTHANYILEKNMAKDPQDVYNLLNKLWKPAMKRAKAEVKEMQAIIGREGGKFKLASWDWWYYAEKVKKAKYNLDENELRPYFKLENVRQGAFDVANKLYGITFEERPEIPVYHPDVKAFEVKDKDGSQLGILFVDYFPRASKRGGAWMNNLRDQYKENGKNIRPVIINVGNFSKPTADKPSLISLEEVTTLFHEFGHALHGLFSNSTYATLSGTSVPRDFVELPSQIMENWALDPEVLKMYAKHYKTGEPIPQTLIDKIVNSGKFNQGFITGEYLAACYLDMDWHTLTDPTEQDVHQFEENSMNKIGLIKEILPRYRSTYFRHIFSGGYSAGYYAYIWAEVLDADAFEAFKETSIFDRATAESFRKNILEKGGTEDPMEMYKSFRGAEPKIEPILKRRGLQ